MSTDQNTGAFPTCTRCGGTHITPDSTTCEICGTDHTVDGRRRQPAEQRPYNAPPSDAYAAAFDSTEASADD